MSDNCRARLATNARSLAECDEITLKEYQQPACQEIIMKNITDIFPTPRGHWVGDGFPVRSLFTYERMGAQHITPFLLLDYAGPADFAPAAEPRGVGAHPHRGFETVTIVYDGEVAHRDSTGG
ncbi:MAG: pirin family protein, partial [Salinisphaera sp.]|nr:pirin family protein [Salinisphaera sp.]